MLLGRYFSALSACVCMPQFPLRGTKLSSAQENVSFDFTNSIYDLYLESPFFYVFITEYWNYMKPNILLLLFSLCSSLFFALGMAFF